MTLLALLASTSDDGPDPEPSNWPATSDPVILAMRPGGRTVASGIATDATTFENLAVSTAQAVTAEGQAGYLAWDYGGPDYRTTVFMQPGATYPGGGAYDWRALVGTDPANRSVSKRRDNSGGVVHSFGSIYMENLHLVPQTTDDNSAPKYPWHITGGKMCIAANCAFDLSEIEPDTTQGGDGIAGWIGADGDSGMTIVLYRCDFIPGPLANSLNIHDGGPPDHPMTLILVECTGLDGVEVFCPGGPSGDGQKNRLYVIDTPVAGVGCDNDGEVWTNSNAPATTGSTGTINRDVTTWPIPEDGLSEFWTDHYYPSSVGATYAYKPAVTDAAPFQPVPGRTYYTRVRPDRAGRYTHSGVTCTTAAGQWAGRMQPADTLYVRDEAPIIESLNPDTTLTVGTNHRAGYYAYSRYPGDNGFWVSVEFSSTSARVHGSSQLAGLTDCAYTDDGTTLVPVAPGTPHPLPFIATAAGTYEFPTAPAPTHASVYGDTPPPGTHTLYTDNGEPITLAQTFRRSTGSPIPDNANIVGGRVYLPSAAPGSTAVKIMLWEGSLDLATAPDREVTVPLNGTTGWVEGIFDTPFPIPSIFTPYRIGYTFIGNPATYIYAPNFRSGAVAVSPQANGIEVTEGFSSFRSGSSGTGSPTSIDVGYGVDILID